MKKKPKKKANKGVNALKHCRLCKFTTRSIALMGAHYRKKHPRAMARKKR